MKVDGGIAADPVEAAQTARNAETAGYAGAWAAETSHDPFLAVQAAARETTHLELGTSIAVAFARTPMTLAVTANDLQRLSQGRFILGLGSQIRTHIENRFSMPWSHPAPRMREIIMAMREIWSCWHEGTKLDFRGEFYTHTLMTPFFDPGSSEFGTPKVFLAGVGVKMTEVAGEVCDGFIAHAFSTPEYFRQVTLPALERGQAQGVRGRTEVAWPVFTVTGTDEGEMANAVTKTKKQLAFYASTPAYRAVLDVHGWGDLQSELHALSKQGRWDEMGSAIPDEVLAEFAVIGTPDHVATEMYRRYQGLADRVTFYTPYRVKPGLLDEISRAIQAQSAADQT
ncbi:TIGR03617 family F420-dependent LLM class oxidoreductase [Mycobacterium sp. shizuoka-1]|uniref:TIGR03617 family F420-dependent LLM class oxidoreductase n=1 Tax=Mycobacterium sp. shizuoka-1 TaxID=2039281 RepID=UPI000C0626F7|nr:TIGR03617 family F420-dependent LLM class oxidoreductase [Mycobacterium sp. shizuoka-1]GAY17685.1 LLM class F420-dependent oxidoreductase [Mycobacterium sp. shizuoka-1]